MPEELKTFAYYVLRYTPNLIRDEWVNIGILLQEVSGTRCQARLAEEASELARIRRLHPDADESLLRNLPADFARELQAAGGTGAPQLEKFAESLSAVLQLSPRRAVLGESFDAELERLYREQVALPHFSGRAAEMFARTRAFILRTLGDAFRRQRLEGKLQHRVEVSEFTEAGDPFKLDYGYRHNGARGYLHAISVARDSGQAKILAYTAEKIRARQPSSEFAAITEALPRETAPREQFVARILAQTGIEIIPVAQIEPFVERLRPLLN